jgi:DinB superfamily
VINFSTALGAACGRPRSSTGSTSLAGVEPQPDTKDWTWTLSRRCPQCGLASGEIEPSEIPQRAFVAAEEWVQILRSSPAVVRRPRPDVWSPLEYGAHVRDVHRVFDSRLARMLAEDGPTFANWDQDKTAIEQRYSEQDPEVVADELEAAAEAFVKRLSTVTPDQLSRKGRRSDGAEFTVATLSQYFLHDVVHHLWDVTGQQDGAATLTVESFPAD